MARRAPRPGGGGARTTELSDDLELEVDLVPTDGEPLDEDTLEALGQVASAEALEQRGLGVEVEDRDPRAQAASRRPEISAATAKANATEKPT